MNVRNKVVVVTGAAGGIGLALARRFAREGASALILSDIDAGGVAAAAEQLDAVGVRGDASEESDIAGLVKLAHDRFGHIDLFCSNAGMSYRDPDIDNPGSPPDEAWLAGWAVNVMAHVYAARHALPGMIARQSGWFLNTVSAAGLLSQVGAAVYSTTKHAAIGFGEHLAIAGRENGIGVSLLCPQAVDTPMLARATGSERVDGVLAPEDVADAVVKGLDDERFLILPHTQVGEYMRRKSSDYDRWLRGMTRLRRSIIAHRQSTS